MKKSRPAIDMCDETRSRCVRRSSRPLWTWTVGPPSATRPSAEARPKVQGLSEKLAQTRSIGWATDWPPTIAYLLGVELCNVGARRLA
jgi:hypothetical protein